MRPSQGFGVTGETGIYFRRTGEQRPTFEGYRETKTILGNMEHKKTFFFIWGENGNKPIYFRGTGTPSPWRASEMHSCYIVLKRAPILKLYVRLLPLLLNPRTRRSSPVRCDVAWGTRGTEIVLLVPYILSCRFGHENSYAAILPLPLI